MNKFLPGFLVGVGLGVLLAPMPGQDTRRMLIERIWKLGGSEGESSDRLTLQTSGSDAPDPDSNVLEQTDASAREPIVQLTDKTQPVTSKNDQADGDGEDTVTTKAVSPLALDPDEIAEPDETFSPTILLSAVPGMEPETEKALEAQGIGTLQQLLDRTPSKQERTNLAHQLGLSASRLKSLIDRADLMQIQGVDGDGATMLEEAGVNGCKDLQDRNPEHLHATLTELYAKKQIALPPPEVEQLIVWIAEAISISAQDESSHVL